MTSGRLGNGWREYHAKVIPLDAPATQVTESRRAFYAGAASMLALICDLSPGDEVTEQDLRNVDALNQELEQFAQAIRERRA